MSENNKISIIVPVYNVEKYIERCIVSIISQDYENFELILINDGSTDRSPEIIEEWVKRDSRIKAIHTENNGVSAARNIGVERASGEYISFIDSDDYIEKDMFSVLNYQMTIHSADIGICNFFFEKYINDKRVRIPFNKETDSDIYLYDNCDGMKALITNKFDNGPCNKIFKKELFRNVQFPIGKKFEDLYTVYKLFANSNKSIYISQPLYIYYQNNEGFMLKNFNVHKLDRITASEERLKFIEKEYPQLSEAAFASCINEKMAAVNDCIRHNGQEKYIIDIKSKIKEERKLLFVNSYISTKRKSLALLLCMTTWGYKSFVKIVEHLRR